MKQFSISGIVGLTLISLFCGCSSETPPRGVAVSGTVSIGGKPLADADVTFMNETFVGYGRTDAEGKYRLVQGALPGTNKIAISKVEGDNKAAAAAAAAGLDPGQAEASAMGTGAAAASGPKQLVPNGYADPGSTKLTFDVPASGAENVDFNL